MRVSKFLAKVLILMLAISWVACTRPQQSTSNAASTPTPMGTIPPVDIEAIRAKNVEMAKSTRNSSDYLKLVERGEIDWVRDFLKNKEYRDKIDINERDKGNRSALILAAKNSDVEMAKLLVEEGIDLDLQDAFGTTALMHAIARNSKEFIDVLFTKKPNVNLKDSTGMSPLMKATGIKDAELRNSVVKELIARKAELNIKTQNGMSLLDYAEPYPDTVKILKQAGAK